MRTKLIRWALPALAAASMLMAQGVSAQTPTPPVECTLAPLELPLFGGTPVASLATPGASASPTAADVSPAAMETTLQLYVACTNTGDPTLVWAMFSPRWFSTTFADPEQHYLPAFEQMLAYPANVAAEPLEMVSIKKIAPQADGGVDVTASFRSGDQEWTDTLSLVLVDGQWLIDDVHLDASAD